LMVTSKGVIKKTLITEFEKIRKTGIIAIKLRKGDSLKKVRIVSKTDKILIVSKKGYAVHMLAELRDMGRNSMGVRGIRLSADDEVIGMEIEEPGYQLLCLTEKGFGKLTAFSKFRETRRGAKGVKAMRIDEKTGYIAACRTLKKGITLIITTLNGNIIQIDTNEIPALNRVSKGVRLIRVNKDDKVIAVARDISIDNNGKES